MNIYELNWTQEFKDTWGASPQNDQLNKPLLLSSLYVGQTSSGSFLELWDKMVYCH